MIAIDTNVVLRLILRDNDAQAAAADALVGASEVYLGRGVIMEAEWVLRRRAGWSRAGINQALGLLLAHRNVRLDTPDLVPWAMQRHASGADLADMLHLIEARATKTFATFDRDLASGAGDDAPVTVRTLP